MTEAKRGRGRPRGKTSDPTYTTLTTYIKVATYKALKKKCVDLDMEMSQVVQQLLDEWLASQGSGFSDHQ